jgi:septal ring factor EnvC (AmiA/AmiB activator)
MDKSSEAILALKPVTFHYKSDAKNTPCFGLVAEEVAKVNRDLVVRDKDGGIYSVRYDAVNAMLLNEFLKEHRKVAQQEDKIQKQDHKAQEQEATIAELKSAMKTLAVTVKEQAAQIQKVSARISVSKPAPQVVSYNP